MLFTSTPVQQLIRYFHSAKNWVNTILQIKVAEQTSSGFNFNHIPDKLFQAQYLSKWNNKQKRVLVGLNDQTCCAAFCRSLPYMQ